MKRFSKILCLIIACVVSTTACGLAGCSKNETSKPENRGDWTITSPDGSIASSVCFDGDGKLSYSVKKNNKPVVDNSSLGFTIEEDDFRILSFENASTKRVQGAYENISGKHSEVVYDCNETTLTFKAWKFYLDVIMRVYDDGYAFRYNVRAIDGSDGTMTVLSENSEFALPERSQLWTQAYKSSDPKNGNYFAYENPYVYRSMKSLGGETLAMPLLYKIYNSDYYSLITESDLIGSGYYGSFLAEQPKNYGTGILQTVHTPAGIAENDNQVGYPFTSPWRMGIVGDMATVVESEMVEKVYDDVEYWKPDNYDELSEEEQKIYDYDWVEPGVAAFNWLRYPGADNQLDYDLHKEYADLAAEMGWKYTILDGNWNNNFAQDEQKIRDFISYANSIGVKVIVWCDAYNTFAKGNIDFLTEKLDLWKDIGAAGIKIDFFSGETVSNPPFQGEDIDGIKWYETVYQECAKRQLLVNAHGANKPTGERRQYPNVINREGIFGNEFATVDSTVTVNHMFTRNILGVSDFTPCVTPRNSSLTMGHQMALAVLFESGLPSMGDYAETYRNELIKNYYQSLPVLRDEIKFIDGAPDEYYCAAINAGDEWFVACINSTEAASVTVDFSFLGSGKFVADYYADVAENNEAVTKTQKELNGSSSETFQVGKYGGFVLHITKKA